MIFAYNKQTIGDTLLVILADDQQKEQRVTRKADIARIQTVDGETVGWNFFHISKVISIEGNGQVTLSDAELALLNEELKKAGFDEQLVADHAPKFVVGYVKTCVAHPDSDHLHVTETEVDHGEVLQIVCGAANIAAGEKVVVAKAGAMMPDGTIIWNGKLRGVASFGMICSAKELGLPNAPEKKGILILDESAQVGAAFPIE